MQCFKVWQRIITRHNILYHTLLLESSKCWSSPLQRITPNSLCHWCRESYCPMLSLICSCRDCSASGLLPPASEQWHWTATTRNSWGGVMAFSADVLQLHMPTPKQVLGWKVAYTKNWGRMWKSWAIFHISSRGRSWNVWWRYKTILCGIDFRQLKSNWFP